LGLRRARYKRKTLSITKYYSGDRIKKNEMGGACSAYGEERGSYSSVGET